MRAITGEKCPLKSILQAFQAPGSRLPVPPLLLPPLTFEFIHLFEIHLSHSIRDPALCREMGYREKTAPSGGRGAFGGTSAQEKLKNKMAGVPPEL